MATYLIDYENVAQHGLDGIEKLTEQDAVIVFAGNQNKTLPTEMAMQLLNVPANTEIKKMQRTASNYLDFQLGTCLGYLIGSKSDTEFYIVGKDGDYQAIIDYWKDDASAKVERRVSICGLIKAPPKAEAKNANTLDNATKKAIRTLVKDEKLSGGNYTGIYNLFLSDSTVQQFHTGLQGLFGEKAKGIYDLLKGTFEDYAASKAKAEQ